MSRLKNWVASTGFVALGSLLACAHQPPDELIAARKAFNVAAGSAASKYAPSDIAKAEQALTEANDAYNADPDSDKARDLSYVALRKAQRASINGNVGWETNRLAMAQAELKNRTQQQLTSTSQRLAQSNQELEAARRGQDEAQRRAAEADEKLQRLGQLRNEERGRVLALSGSVLFASGKSKLLPSASSRLSEVADALKATQEHIVIEGYTDSKGKEDYNKELSERRAQSVRDFLVSRGLESSRVDVIGMGEERPVADNSTAEGRANNRRVEIVLQKPSNAPSTGVGGSGTEPIKDRPRGEHSGHH